MRYFQFQIFAIILGLSVLISCGEKAKNNNPISPSSLSQFVSSHMPSNIQAKDAIRVRFVESVQDSENFPIEVSAELYKIQPTIKGTAVWEDPYTFRFKPTAYFIPNQTYQIEFNQEKLFGESANNLKELTIGFGVLPNKLNIHFNPPKPISSEDNNYVLTGTLSSGLPVQTEDINGFLNVEFSGKQPEIKWSTSDNGSSHNFEISPIIRKEKGQKLSISWNGKSLHSNNQGERRFEIPAEGDFKIVDIDVQQSGGKKITVHFSDNLKKSNNVDGFIQLDGSDKKYKTELIENRIILYPNNEVTGQFTLSIKKFISNTQGQTLTKNALFDLSFEDLDPQIRTAGKGVIMPNTDEVVFPFEYVNIKGVTVEVFEVFENNVMQFLQYSELNDEWGLDPVGRIIKQEQVDLEWSDDQRNVWQRTGIDLSKITNISPGSIYQIRIGFQMADAYRQCENELQDLSFKNSNEELTSIMQYNYDYPGFDYSQVDDPCYPAFYNEQRFISRNVLASNLGIMAKGNSQDQLTVFVQDIRTTQALAGVEVSAYDFQQQLITQSKTNAQGMCELTPNQKPYFIIASNGVEKGYVKLAGSMTRSLSEFDVSGVKASKGFKGFIYGEREVWRPGDTLFLNFILGGRAHQESDEHPVSFKLYNPRGQVAYTRTQSNPVGPIYSFYIPTDKNDLTGNWRAEFDAGGAQFSKMLKVETIMPNRLKIKYNTDQAIAGFQKKNELELQSNWLHGAPAKNLKAKVEMQLNNNYSGFSGYSKYVFTDPTRRNVSKVQTIFDGVLNQQGGATIEIPKAQQISMPGKMKATIKTRVFEEGGAFSSDQFSTDFDPFEKYVGLMVPSNRWGSKRLEIDVDNEVKAVILNRVGKPVTGQKLVVGIYESEWRWWWDRSDRSIAQFSSSQHQGAFYKDTLTTNANGEISVQIKPEQYGSYLIRVCDQEGGHCSGDFYYAGRRWGGDDEGRNAAAKLVFSADKTEYNVGDQITLTIPTAPKSSIQISLENQSGIVLHEKIEAQDQSTTYTFEATEEMLPNIYAHVDMIQPHNHGENDLPIRMYGIIPIQIVDPSTILNPIVKMPEELAPEQSYEITVSEKNNQPMAYTIAVVDEGLLDLTRAKTPNPHKSFFSKEALDMNTWDMYDFVMNNYGGQVDRLMSIGGGGEVAQVDGVQEANRFKPVVQHLGPFFIKKGEQQTHQIKMENYVGAVRTMIVAAGNKKYGHFEKSTPVKKPLMVLATLPRKLSPGETVAMPVNVFAMDQKVKDVTVRIRSSGELNIVGAAEKTITFSEVGDQMVHFTISAMKGIGQAKLIIEAISGREEASQEIELNVINPNPIISEVINVELEGSQSHSFSEQAIGSVGTQNAMLEVYGVFPFNIEKRLKYLIQYPYGCLEQTVSSAFPQLFVGNLMDLSKEQKNRVQRNVDQAILKIKRHIVPGGGFAYWPGSRHINDWSNSYAGHFLLEAREAGYYVEEEILSTWKKHQIKASNSFDLSSITKSEHYWGEMSQAYRMYTLAKMGEPEFGSMNRLKSEIKTTGTAQVLLAASYALAGQKSIASEMLNNIDSNISDYQQTGYTYGSSIRDRALIVEALVSIGDHEKAAPILRRISEQMDRNEWMSTQSTAFSLIALSKFYNGRIDHELNFSFTPIDGDKQIVQSQKPVFQIELIPNQNGLYQFDLENLGGQISFVRIIKRGQPEQPIIESSQSHLKMKVLYTDMAGRKIDHTKLEQGTDFIAEVSIENPGTLRRTIDEMALQQIFPSGWEVINQRMSNFQNALKSSSFDYQDNRDDRVYTFFDLNKGKPLVYKVALNAAYEGRYLLPGVQCEAMYDHSISAIEAGEWVEVIRPSYFANNGDK